VADAVTPEQLDAYARTAVEVGVNIQRDQVLHVQAPADAADFVRRIVRAAYAAGAWLVDVELYDERVARIRYEAAPEASLAEFPPWRAEATRQLGERGAAFLNVAASDPDLLKGIDPQRVATAQRAAMAAMEQIGHMARMTGMRNAWSIVAVPTPVWAAKVFPGEPAPAQASKLWTAILHAAHADGGDPVAAWRTHLTELQARTARLNAMRLASVRFTGPGTDLTIDLPGGHLWTSAPTRTPDGVAFVPNMPTEEIFTAPSRTGARGTVRSTRPVPVRGVVVEDMCLTFAEGRVVSATAATGEDVLRGLLDTDGGAGRLGELALVPEDSAVAELGTLFFNPLYDENAACHLALGRAYPICLEGGAGLSDGELNARGINTSLVHLDFMVGSGEVDVDGLGRDGAATPLLRRGRWAFGL
jgi:aminopeptidase